ncbi:hypothetical protein WJX72_011993 [[Myrmecia] bisecta]|uniref:Uncharacterized protein n=1 Tax=[Myrmecia] bisecta TaxID=41462 RepID=A0AAW1PI62_9CHLO
MSGVKRGESPSKQPAVDQDKNRKGASTTSRSQNASPRQPASRSNSFRGTNANAGAALSAAPGGASDPGMAAKLKALSQQVDSLKEVAGPKQGSSLDTKVVDMSAELELLRSENFELHQCFERALEEAEKLKAENEELRKMSEDAVLDQQLVKALNETEKLKAAADAYKKDLLQQKLAEREWELAQAREQLKEAEDENSGLTQALTEVRAKQQESHAQVDHLRREAAMLKARLGGEEPAAAAAEAAEVTSAVKDHEALASKLLAASGQAGLDSALAAEAAKALKDAVALEKQLAKAKQDNERLKQEVEELNDTVFSKSFKAPSAWAEREVKYKMDKKAWEAQTGKLREALSTLKAENLQYKANLKSDEFELRIKELEARVKKTEKEKVTAQQALHELQLEMRKADELARNAHESRKAAREADDAGQGVLDIVEDLDSRGIGVQHLRTTTPRTPGSGKGGRGTPAGTPERSAAERAERGTAEAVAGAPVNQVVEQLNELKIGPQNPQQQQAQQSVSRLASSSRGVEYGAEEEVRSGAEGVGQLTAAYRGGQPEAVDRQQQAMASTSGLQPSGPADASSDNAVEGSTPADASSRDAGGEAVPAGNGAGATAEFLGSGMPSGPTEHASTAQATVGPAQTADASAIVHHTGGKQIGPESPHVGTTLRTSSQSTPRLTPYNSATDADAAEIVPAFVPAGSARSRGESDSSEWTEERLHALEDDKAAVEKMWGAYEDEADIGVLRYKAAELATRAELYEAQITKMQMALERADQEKAKLEEELTRALEGVRAGDHKGLLAMKDRLRHVMNRRATTEEDLEDRLKEAEAMLQGSYRERQALERQKAALEKQLLQLGSKLGIQIALPETSHVAVAEPTTPTSGGGSGKQGSLSPRRGTIRRANMSGVIAGLSDEDMEVIRLREENEALMESLVRAKVELAETQGDYLKVKRSFIRAIEKQAELTEKVDELKHTIDGQALALYTSDSMSAGQNASPRRTQSDSSTAAPLLLLGSASMANGELETLQEEG